MKPLLARSIHWRLLAMSALIGAMNLFLTAEAQAASLPHVLIATSGVAEASVHAGLMSVGAPNGIGAAATTTRPIADKTRRQRHALRRICDGLLFADARRNPRQHHAVLADQHGSSSSRLYWEYKGGFFNAKGVNIPVAVTVFPGEQYEAPRTWTEKAYPNLIYYNRTKKGGHFAAWEQPVIFAQELRAAFKSLR